MLEREVDAKWVDGVFMPSVHRFPLMQLSFDLMLSFMALWN